MGGQPTTEELMEIARFEASRRLTVSSHHIIDDTAQRAMVEFLEYAARNEVPNPGGLMRTIARRAAAKERNAWEGRRDFYWIDGADDDGDDHDAEAGVAGFRGGGRAANPAGRDGDPLTGIIATVDRSLLAYALSTLDDRDRRIVELTYLGTRPRKAEDVAGELGIAAGTVRNRLVRVRRALADILAEDPDRR